MFDAIMEVGVPTAIVELTGLRVSESAPPKEHLDWAGVPIAPSVDQSQRSKADREAERLGIDYGKGLKEDFKHEQSKEAFESYRTGRGEAITKAVEKVVHADNYPHWSDARKIFKIDQAKIAAVRTFNASHDAEATRLRKIKETEKKAHDKSVAH